jgi:hypothetical protein
MKIGMVGRGDGLWDAVTLMRTSPGPGLGISRVPSVTGFPISVTKSAFWVFSLVMVGTVCLELCDWNCR